MEEIREKIETVLTAYRCLDSIPISDASNKILNLLQHQLTEETEEGFKAWVWQRIDEYEKINTALTRSEYLTMKIFTYYKLIKREK